MSRPGDPTAPMRFGMVAGETSGDLLAGLLMDGLRQRWPALQTAGIGGPRMIERGFDAWWPCDRLAVRGYVEVLRHYRGIVAIRRQLAARLQAWAPDAFIGVDAPDFNLDLEGRLRAAGIRSIHFVSPSIWAWRAGRIDKIRRCVDHVLCLFPFEPEIYARAGVPASYVGHPLADEIPLEVPRAAARAALGYRADDVVVGVLPGSRRSELQYLGEVFAAAAARMVGLRPGLRCVMPVAPGLRAMAERALVTAGASGCLRLVDGQSHDVLAASDVVLVASGTATLEAALFKRPMVIGYRMHWLSWQMMRRMAYLPWVGLPNILCRAAVVPECLQHEANAEGLAAACLAWLDDPVRCEALERRFLELHLTLRRDTAAAATEAIAHVLARG